MNNIVNFSDIQDQYDVHVTNNTEISVDAQDQFADKFFTIEEKDLFTDMGMVDNKKALYVEDNLVNIVSKNRFNVHQPKEIFDVFQSNTNLTVDTVITNKYTGGMLLSSVFDSPILGGEEHQIKTTFYTGHNGKYCSFFSLQGLRLCCMNQLPALYADQDLFLMKSKHFNEFDFNKLDELLDTIPLHISNFKIQYEKLQDIKYTKEQFLADFIEHYKIQEERKDKVIANISDIYNHAQGQETITDDSAYKAYQAITYKLTHLVRNSKNILEVKNIANQQDAFTWFNKLAA